MPTTAHTRTTPDGPLRVYEAIPAGTARAGVVVVQEAFGVNPHIEDVTRRLAAAGYHAVAPDFFHRTAPAGGEHAVLDYGDFGPVMEHLGGIVTGRFPQFPPLIDEAGALQTPWLGLFGDQDGSIPVDDVETLRTALKSAPVPTEIVRYAEAGHGFHCDRRDDYKAADAQDAWARTLDWFATHLRSQAR